MDAKTQPTAPEHWLRGCIADNLEQLVTLHLDGAPPAETIGLTAQTWLRAMTSWPIVWNEKLDRPRVDAAFLALTSQVQRWPSPSQLRALLPARTYPESALDAPEYPAAKAAANRAKIRQLIADAFKMRELKSKLARLQSDRRMPLKEKAEAITTLKAKIVRLQQRIDQVGQS